MMLPNTIAFEEGQPMSPRSKKEYQKMVFLRHKKASRHDKISILDEFCTTCHCHRRHDMRLLTTFKRSAGPRQKKRSRKAIYRAEGILLALSGIWRAATLPCSKRLKVIIPLWLPGYAAQADSCGHKCTMRRGAFPGPMRFSMDNEENKGRESQTY